VIARVSQTPASTWMKPSFVPLVVLVGASWTGVARADAPPAEAMAEALFEQARDDMRHENYEAAYTKLEESQRIDPADGTLLNLLICEDKIGKTASAWLHAKELLDRMPTNDDRRSLVEQRFAALVPRLTKLTIRLAPTAPSGTRLSLDGVQLASTGLGVTVPIDPGVHRIVVSAAGREDRFVELAMRESGEYNFLGEPGAPRVTQQATNASLGGVVSPTKPADEDLLRKSPEPDVSSTKTSGPPKWIGWTSGGIGAAGLVAAGTMGIMALDRLSTVHDLCSDKNCTDQAGVDAGNEGKVLIVGTVISAVVGVVGLGVGVYILTRDDTATPAASMPSVSRSPAGALVTYGAKF